MLCIGQRTTHIMRITKLFYGFTLATLLMGFSSQAKTYCSVECKKGNQKNLYCRGSGDSKVTAMLKLEENLHTFMYCTSMDSCAAAITAECIDYDGMAGPTPSPLGDYF